MKILRFKKDNRSASSLYLFLLSLSLLLIPIAFYSGELAVVAIILQFIYFIFHRSLHSKEILIDEESSIITIARRFPITFNRSVGFLKDVFVLSNDVFMPFDPSQSIPSRIFYQGNEYSLVKVSCCSKMSLVS